MKCTTFNLKGHAADVFIQYEARDEKKIKLENNDGLTYPFTDAFKPSYWTAGWSQGGNGCSDETTMTLSV
jgi:hypothetical protein